MKRPIPFLLAAFIAFCFFPLSPARGSGMAGRRVFMEAGCGRCHSVARPGTLTRADFLAQKGPDLWYAGTKFKPAFLSSWLAAPRPIRPLAYNSLVKKNKADHPRLSVSGAKAVAVWLMTLKADDLIRPVGIRPGVNVRGRIVFIKKFACYGCHQVAVRGTLAGGLSGPSFEGVSERLNPEWIYTFLTNPRAFSPISRMPVYAGLAKKSEMMALASYVAGLN